MVKNVNNKHVMTRFLFMLAATVLVLTMTACGGGSKGTATAPPKERSYDIQDPNGDYEGKSAEERQEILFSKLSEISGGETQAFDLADDYQIVHSFIEYDQNIHTRKEVAKIKQVTYHIGKVASDYKLSKENEELIRYYNSNNRFLWMYGPFESSDDVMVLSLHFNNPIMNRHLEPNSYNYPVEIRKVADDKPVLVFTQLVTSTDQQRTNYQVYEWQAVGDHRYRLEIKQGSPAESAFDAMAFIESTFK